MKFYRLAFLINILLLVFLPSCEEELPEFDLEPVKITIHHLPAEFPPDTMLYIGLNQSSAIGAVERKDFEARGNALVDSDGTAEISLHRKTGEPWNMTWDEYRYSVSGYITILENVRAEKWLYSSKEKYDFPNKKNFENNKEYPHQYWRYDNYEETKNITLYLDLDFDKAP